MMPPVMKERTITRGSPRKARSAAQKTHEVHWIAQNRTARMTGKQMHVNSGVMAAAYQRQHLFKQHPKLPLPLPPLAPPLAPPSQL